MYFLGLDDHSKNHFQNDTKKGSDGIPQSLALIMPTHATVLGYTAIQMFFALCGGTGNLLAFLSIMKAPHLRLSAANTLFALQSLNDAIILLVLLPPFAISTLAYRFGSRLPLHPWWCPITYGLMCAFQNASPLSQMLIAINRCTAVFWPFTYRLVLGRRRVVLWTWLIFTLGVSCLFHILPLFDMLGATYDLMLVQGVCNINYPSASSKPWEYVREILFTYVPFTVMLLAYTAIFIKLRCYSGPPRGSGGGGVDAEKATRDANDVHVRARGSLMMFSVFVSYFLCVVPMPVIIDVGREQEFNVNPWTFYCMLVLIFLNFTLNPVFYALLNRYIREAMEDFCWDILRALESTWCLLRIEEKCMERSRMHRNNKRQENKNRNDVIRTVSAEMTMASRAAAAEAARKASIVGLDVGLKQAPVWFTKPLNYLEQHSTVAEEQSVTKKSAGFTKRRASNLV